MTQEIDPRDERVRTGGKPPAAPVPPAPAQPQPGVQLTNAAQRGGMIAAGVVMIVIGVLAILIGLFTSVLFGGTAMLIAGSVFTVGGVIVLVGVGALSWWQFESRQQLGLLAQGLDEIASRNDSR